MTERQKVAVVTGASSGVGKAAAKMLAARGWHVIALGRDPGRSADAEAEIRAAGSADAKVDMITGDLALLSDTTRMAREIAGRTDRVDALLNNAGGVRAEKSVTAEGNEATFAGNHLGHFLLTDRLLPLLRKAAEDRPRGSVRIVAVSSKGHESTPGFDWDDVQSLDNFVSGGAYCRAKLANILFTRELARRLGPEGIVAHAMHPGVIDSNFITTADAGMQSYMRTLDLQPPETGAKTLAWLAASPEAGETNGLYFYDCAPIPTAANALDDEAARRLWKESEKLVAKAGV